MDLEQFDENEHSNHKYSANTKKIITNMNLKYWWILLGSVTEIAWNTEVKKKDNEEDIKIFKEE